MHSRDAAARLVVRLFAMTTAPVCLRGLGRSGASDAAPAFLASILQDCNPSPCRGTTVCNVGLRVDQTYVRRTYKKNIVRFFHRRL